MPFHITRDHVRKYGHVAGSASHDASAAEKKLARQEERSKKLMTEGIALVEVGGAAFGFGLLQGRQGGMPEVPYIGLSADLFTGIVLHLIGALGWAGKYEEHAHNLANGAIASWAVNQGALLGEKMRKDASAAAPAPTPAVAGLTSGGYEDAYLRAVAAQQYANNPYAQANWGR